MKITKETRTKRPVKKMNAGNRLKRVALALLVVWLLLFAFDTWRILRFVLGDVRLFQELVLPLLHELADIGTLYAIGVILDRVITSRNEKERILYLLEGKTAPGPDCPPRRRRASPGPYRSADQSGCRAVNSATAFLCPCMRCRPVFERCPALWRGAPTGRGMAAANAVIRR